MSLLTNLLFFNRYDNITRQEIGKRLVRKRVTIDIAKDLNYGNSLSPFLNNCYLFNQTINKTCTTAGITICNSCFSMLVILTTPFLFITPIIIESECIWLKPMLSHAFSLCKYI